VHAGNERLRIALEHGRDASRSSGNPRSCARSRRRAVVDGLTRARSPSAEARARLGPAVARIITGIFGGLSGSISFTILADLFPFAMRGRVAGLVQASFAGAQIMGLPIGLFLANRWGWHAPFFMIVGVALLGGVAIVFVLQPITGHLAAAQGMGRKTVQHPLRTAASAVTVGLMFNVNRLVA